MELLENVKKPDSPHDTPEQTGEHRPIHHRILSVTAATFLSRVAGFLRDMAIAYGFGTGQESDLFYIGYRIPNMLRELFAEGTLSSAFIPTLTRSLRDEGPRTASRLYTSVGIVLSMILLCVLLAGEWGAPYLLDLLAPGYSTQPASHALGTMLIRIMFPFLIFISLSALAMGALNVQGRFFIPALSPILFSLGLALGAFLPPELTFGHRVYGLAFGVVLGGILQWVIQWPSLAKGQIHYVPEVGIPEAVRDPGTRKVLKLLLPSIGGLWVTQGNLLIATVFGSLLMSGTISALYYAMRLIQFPLGLIGAAIATVILPILARQTLEEKGAEKASRTLSDAYRLSFFFMLPASAGLVALAPPLIRVLFQHGAFQTESAHMTEQALFGYALGLWSFSGVRILVRAFYAHQDTRFPVWAGIWGLLTNLLISWIFFRPDGILALALGISAGSLVNHAILFFGLRKYLHRTPWEIFGNALPVLFLSAWLYEVVFLAWKGFTSLWGEKTVGITLTGIGITILVGIGFYLLSAAYVFKIREGVSIIQTILKKAKGTA
ncbi:MAG: murein biosynthesis integral membrane protein MurJ [Leptospirales bacterium]